LGNWGGISHAIRREGSRKEGKCETRKKGMRKKEM
jgi:hypothetical protein